jgi:hypothetical protein
MEWACPTGEAFKIENGSFTDLYRFGLDEWLFRDAWVLDGWRYGHVHGVDDSRTKLLKGGEPFDVVLFTIEPDKRRRFVAILRHAECIIDGQAEAALEQYRSNGWYAVMREEAEAVGGKIKFFEEDRPAHHILNLRYRLEQVEFFPPGTYIGPGHDIISSSRYKLIDLKGHSLPAATALPPLSAMLFEKALGVFQASEIRERGKPLTTFRDPTTRAYAWEEYKTRVALLGKETMDAASWRKKDIGTGIILGRVIAAIEHKDNNLVTWDGRYGDNARQHACLLNARSDKSATLALEKMFFELYKRKQADREHFERLVELCEKPFALIAFLFFLADRERNLPIRPSRFEATFERLGIHLRLAGEITWEKYQAYLRALAQVRNALQRFNIPDATLLDAHSFCWILSSEDFEQVPVLPLVRRRESGITIIEPAPSDLTKPVESARWVDLDEQHRRQVSAGKRAEAIVFRDEVARLTDAGRADLAAEVKDVSDYPAFGYDILSFETSGKKRCIEVKNTTNTPSFYITDNEWQKSRGESNYWFYLVSGIDSPDLSIQYVNAKEIDIDDLQPVQWRVRFKRES